MRNNYLDFAPRVGFAYQLTNKTVIRSAYGIFYNSTFVQELQDMRKFWPYTIQQNFSANQGVRPDLLDYRSGPSFSNTSAIGGWPQNPNNRTPYSATMELHNPAAIDDRHDARRRLCRERQQAAGRLRPYQFRTDSRPRPHSAAPAAARLTATWMAAITNSIPCTIRMRVNLVKRFSKGVQLNANYTWGRSMTNSSSLAEATVQNPYDLKQEWARASIDLRHIFQLAYVYEFHLAAASVGAQTGMR